MLPRFCTLGGIQEHCRCRCAYFCDRLVSSEGIRQQSSCHVLLLILSVRIQVFIHVIQYVGKATDTRLPKPVFHVDHVQCSTFTPTLRWLSVHPSIFASTETRFANTTSLTIIKSWPVSQFMFQRLCLVFYRFTYMFAIRFGKNAYILSVVMVFTSFARCFEAINDGLSILNF